MKPIYVKPSGQGVGVSHSNFRGIDYIHINFMEWDPDEERWYRVKGLAITEDCLDPVIEGLEKISEERGRYNLPDSRQLEFGFLKDYT